MKTNIKQRLALLASITALIGAAVLGIWLFGVHSRAVDMDPSPVSNTPLECEADDGFPVVDWEYWLSVNPDIAAWVSVPGTDIDYPVVQASAADPTFYLDHDVYRGWNPYGCPYLDAGCAERGIDSPLALMLAHHMNDGSMFSAFASYSDIGLRRGTQRDSPSDARGQDAPERHRGGYRGFQHRIQAFGLRRHRGFRLLAREAFGGS